MRNIKAQSRSLTNRLGRLKGVEYVFHLIVRDPLAGIPAFDQYTVRLLLILCHQGDLPMPCAHRLNSILDHIHKHLTQIGRITFYYGQVVVLFFFNFNLQMFIQIIQNPERVIDCKIHVNRFCVDLGLA